MGKLENQEITIKESKLEDLEKKKLLNSIRNERRQQFTCIDEIDIHSDMSDLKIEYENKETLEILNTALSNLNPMEIKIIEGIYFENKTLKTISNELKVSTRTIRRKEEQILRKLKEYLLKIGGKDYVFRING